jgi:hypothetical protein
MCINWLWGVANGPSKTIGLAKFLSNFMGLRVLVFLVVVCLSQAWFFHKAVSESWFFARQRKSQSPDLFVCFYKWCLNVLESEHLKLAFKTLWSLGLAIYKVKNVLGSQRKRLVSPSRKVLHLPFTTPTVDSPYIYFMGGHQMKNRKHTRKVLATENLKGKVFVFLPHVLHFFTDFKDPRGEIWSKHNLSVFTFFHLQWNSLFTGSLFVYVLISALSLFGTPA